MADTLFKQLGSVVASAVAKETAARQAAFDAAAK